MEHKEMQSEDEAFILGLIERTRAICRRRMARILGDFACQEIEDCEAELWLLLCAKAPLLRAHENPDGWAFVAADHIAQSFFRRRAKEMNRSSELEENQNAAEGSLEDRVINDLLYEQWEKEGYKEELLSLLNKKERVIYELRYTKGLSFEEIAEKTGKSSAAVQMTLSRIRKRIVSAIRENVRFPKKRHSSFGGIDDD